MTETLVEKAEQLLGNIKWKDKLKQTIDDYRDLGKVANQFFDVQPFFYDKSKSWWIWNIEKYCWERVDEIDIMNALDDITKDFYTAQSSIKNELIEMLKRVGRKHIPKDIEPTWIQIGNRIIDVENYTELEARPEFFVTNPITWEVSESEETPTMDKIFTEWVGEKYKDTLYEIIAYCMLPNYPIHRIFCMNGIGCNGKGRFLALISKFVGTDNVCSTSLEQLVKNRFETSRLYRKLVCLLGETDTGVLSRTDMLKRLCGQDQVPFEYKGKDGFTSVNYAKIIIATNSLPATTDKTIGFYRRWLIIDWTNIFPEGKDILDIIPEEEYNNLAKKIIRILHDLLENGSFKNEGDIEARKKQYETVSNPVSAFIKKSCVEDVKTKIQYSEFNSSLQQFLREKKVRKLSRRDIRNLLDLEGLTVERVHETREDGLRTTSWYIIGLKWKEGVTTLGEFN